MRNISGWKFKRYVAAIMAAVMIITGFLPSTSNSLASNATSKIASDMLDIDGGFENEPTSWEAKDDDRKILWEKTKDTEGVRSGTYAARIYYNANGTKADKYNEWWHKSFDVEPNTIYKLTYYIKNDNFTDLNGYVGIWSESTSSWVAGDKNLSKMLPATTNAATDWTEMTVTFTTDSDTTKAKIYMTFNLNVVENLEALEDGASFYVDDFSIQRIGNAAIDASLAKIGETEITKWNATPDGLDGAVEKVTVKSGEGLKISANDTSVGTSFSLTSESFPVKSDTAYALNYFVKTEDFPGLNYGLSIYDADSGSMLATNLGAGKTGIGFSTDWVECDGMFTTASSTQNIYIKISAYTDEDEELEHEASASFYLDDITIEEAPETAINDGTFDGSFDRVYAGCLLNWSAGSGSNGLTIGAGKVSHEGDYSLKITNKTGKSGEYQMIQSNTFTIKANETYDVTYYVKNDNFNDAVIYACVMDGATELNERGVVVLNDNYKSGWKKQTVRFTNGNEDKEVCLRITARASEKTDAGACFYIDTVFVSKVEEAGKNDGTFDGSFDKVYDGTFPNWTSGSEDNGLVMGVANTSYKGNYSMQITTTTGEQGSYQKINSNPMTLKANETYDITYYVKNKNFNGAVIYACMIDGEDGVTELNERVVVILDDSYKSDWKKVTVRLTMGNEDKEGYLCITARAGEEVKAGACFYIDAVSVSKVEEAGKNDGTFDGGFDRVYKKEFTNWISGNEANGLVVGVASTSHEGKYSMQITSTTGEQGGYQKINSNPMTLKANETYDITYYIKNKNFNGAVVYACIIDGEDGETELSERGVVILDDSYKSDWKKQTVRFTMGDEDKEVFLCITARAGEEVKAGACFYIDTVSVSKVEEAGKNDGELDGGFERVYNNEFTNWSYDSRNTMEAVPSTEAHSGKYALMVRNTSTELGYQEIVSNKYAVEPNTTYDISYFMKNISFPENTTGYVAVFDAADATTTWLGAKKDLGNWVVTASTKKEWKRYVGEFTTNEDTTEVVIKFVVSTKIVESELTGGESLLIDDLSIEESIVETTLIKNPDFERIDLIAWRTACHPMNADGVVDASIANNMDAARVEGGQHGDYSLYMQADVRGYAAVLQDSIFQVKPATTYKFTYYVRTENAENASAYAMILAYQEDGVTPSAGNYTQTTHTAGNVGEWKKVTTYYTTADNQHYMNVQLNLSVDANFQGNVPAMAWFDNLSLEEVETIGEKGNLGFEYIDNDSLYDWSYAVYGSGADALNLDATKFGWSVETNNVKEGTKALKVVAESKDGYALFTSRRISMESGSRYKLTYWVNVSGSITSSVGIGVHYTVDDGTPANKEWEWASDNIVKGPTDDWKQVSTYITVPEDATYADIRLNVSGANTTVLLDDIQLEKYILDDDQNFGFETGDHNWKIAGGDASIDTELYHGGSQSLHITKSSQSDTKITSMVYTSVEYGDTYMFGGWYKSANNINSRVRINLNCYDADGNMLKEDGSRRVILGPEVTGNSDDESGEWQRLMYSGNIPDDTVTVGLEIVVTDGRAEMWFDDLFIRQCNVSDEEQLVDYTYMEEIDNLGNMESVSLMNISGDTQLTFENGSSVLNVQADSEGYVSYTTEWMVSGEAYKVMLHNYTADKEAALLVKYYDYNNEYMEEMDTEVIVPASSEWADFETTVVVPTSVRAKICFGSSNAGSYKLSQIDIVNVEQSDAAASWIGKWIWYNEDTLINCQYQSRYFRHKFTLEEEPVEAPLQITCDDLYTVYVNGQEVGSDMDSTVEEWGTPTTYDLTPYLKKGENIIAVEGYNRVSYGALVYDARITMSNEEQVLVCSNIDDVVSNTSASGNWKEYDYDDSSWKKPKDVGKVGVSPWGEIYFDASLYADKKITIESFEARETAYTDSTVLIDATIEIENEFDDDYPFEVNIYKKNSTTLITSSVLDIVEGGKPSEWKTGKNEVTFEIYIPDYLQTGNYTLQLSDSYYYLMNEDVIERKFANITVLAANEKQELAKAEIKQVNGTPTIYVNGEAKSAMLYQEPAGNLWFNAENEAKYMENTGVEIYVANRLALSDQSGRCSDLWLDENTYDWDALDNIVYSILSADPDALIIPTIDVRAPAWWLDMNPDEELLLYDAEQKKYVQASVRSESFSSEKWKETSTEVIGEIVEHLMNASYASHIIGCRFVDGDTSEFMTQDVEGDIVADFSPASLNGFRKWLEEKYETNEALQEAYHDSEVTFETVTVPTYDERNNVWLSTDGVSDTIIKNPEEDRWVIDYNYYSGIVSSEMFMSYCSALKEASDGQWLAGGYNGYTWVFAGVGGIARVHPGVDMVLDCEDVDFICSPYIYGERTKGEDSALDAMIDGVQNAGKLYILEIDTRSVYEGSSGNADTDASVGNCYTMAESIESLKRDMSSLVAEGAGFWIYNMYGIWWYDDQMLSVVREVRQEMEYSMFMGSETQNDVAVFVDEMNYPYLANSEVYSATRTYYYLYQWQRRNLATMGTGYDMYNMSDLVKGNLKKDYKINIMLSPYEITADEKSAIEKELKRDGKIIVWINLSGISDGTKNDMDYMRELTGFNVQYLQTKGAQTGYFVSGNELTVGIEGYIYGDDATGATNGVGPLLYVDTSNDTGVIELAKSVFDESKAALVMKDMGDWTSIYSAPMGLPSRFLRNLVKYANGHIYSDNTADIIHASSTYLSVYNLYGGKRTITLPEKCSVYDVYAQEYVVMNGDTFEVEMDANDTKLYRLMQTDNVAVVVMTKGGHATIDKEGVTEIALGETYSVHVQVEDGYRLSSVVIDGEQAEVTDTLVLENVEDTHHIIFETEQIKTYGSYVTSLDVRWGRIAALLAAMIAGVVCIGTVLEVGVVLIRRKKKKAGRRA